MAQGFFLSSSSWGVGPPAKDCMPIRFRCEHCQQRLSVGSKKAGAVVLCPKCNNKIVVPSETPTEEARPAVGLPQPPAATFEDAPGEPNAAFPEFSVYEYETEFVYEDVDDEETTREAIDLDKVAVPRWILYAQGALLGVMALVGFAFGVMIGGSGSRGGAATEEGGPYTIMGRVAYNAGDHLPTPDAGAAVLLTPQDARPEQKALVASFRPGSQPVDASDPAIMALREIGGDFTRADAEGNFRLVAPRAGAYFLLIISAHLERSADDRVAPQHLAEIGRYVESAPALLGQNRYAWTRQRINGNETVSHVFR